MGKREGFAHISECEKYRYLLTRPIEGDGVGVVTFIMKNPSTADATSNDPTIRKCMGFAQRWGFDTLMVVNCMAWRSTDPRQLPDVETAIGPNNDHWVRDAMGYAELVVPAWGRERKQHRAAYAAARQAIADIGHPRVEVLGYNWDGSPLHPLMPAYKTARQPWPIGA